MSGQREIEQAFALARERAKAIGAGSLAAIFALGFAFGVTGVQGRERPLSTAEALIACGLLPLVGGLAAGDARMASWAAGAPFMAAGAMVGMTVGAWGVDIRVFFCTLLAALASALGFAVGLSLGREGQGPP